MISCEIKEDTTRILGDTCAPRQNTTGAIDRPADMRLKLSSDEDPPLRVVLDRLLDQGSNGTEKVLSRIAHQMDIL